MLGRGRVVEAEQSDRIDTAVYERFARLAALPLRPGSEPGPEPGVESGAEPRGGPGGPGPGSVPEAGPGGSDPGAGARAEPVGCVDAGVLDAFNPGRRGVRAVAAAAVLVVLVAGFLAWRAIPATEPVPVRTEGTQSPSGGQPGTIVVAVAGRVQRPGLVRVPAGSRVADAIEAAGGVLPGTDLAYLNLARKLVDGELVLVGVVAPSGVAVGPGADGTDGQAPGGKVNLNTAGLTELQTLPGVGPVLAQRIVDYRTKHGGFRAITDLRQVDGIGSTRFEQLKDLVTV